MLQTILVSIQPYIVELASVGVAVVVANTSTYLNRKWRLDINEKHKQALHNALMNGIRSALAQDISLRKADVFAVDYAKRTTPDAIKHFKVTDGVLRDIASSYVSYFGGIPEGAVVSGPDEK